MQPNCCTRVLVDCSCPWTSDIGTADKESLGLHPSHLLVSSSVPGPSFEPFFESLDHCTTLMLCSLAVIMAYNPRPEMVCVAHKVGVEDAGFGIWSGGGGVRGTSSPLSQ